MRLSEERAYRPELNPGGSCYGGKEAPRWPRRLPQSAATRGTSLPPEGRVIKQAIPDLEVADRSSLLNEDRKITCLDRMDEAGSLRK